MNLLALDAVTPHASVAVSCDGEIRYERTWLAGRNHASALPPILCESMTVSDLVFPDLDGVVVGIGPGSYTGIRIALALAKGIQAATGCTLLGISTLEQIAYGNAAWGGPICSAALLGRDRVGCALFQGSWQGWSRMTEDASYPLDALPSLSPGALVCGSGRTVFAAADVTYAPPQGDIPTAGDLLALAGRPGRIEQAANSFVPNYLRLSTPEERLVAAP